MPLFLKGPDAAVKKANAANVKAGGPARAKPLGVKPVINHSKRNTGKAKPMSKGVVKGSKMSKPLAFHHPGGDLK